MDRDKMIAQARMRTAEHDLSEFYSAVAFSGYNHAIDKLNEVIADFALQVAIPDAVREERERIISRLEQSYAAYDPEDAAQDILIVIEELRATDRS